MAVEPLTITTGEGEGLAKVYQPAPIKPVGASALSKPVKKTAPRSGPGTGVKPDWWYRDNANILQARGDMENYYADVYKAGLDLEDPSSLDPNDPNNQEALIEWQKRKDNYRATVMKSKEDKTTWEKNSPYWINNADKFTDDSLQKTFDYYNVLPVSERMTQTPPIPELIEEEWTPIKQAKEVAFGLTAVEQLWAPYKDETTGYMIFPSATKVLDDTIAFAAEEDWKNSPKLQKEYPGPEGLKAYTKLVSKYVDPEKRKRAIKAEAATQRAKAARQDIVTKRGEIIDKALKGDQTVLNALKTYKINGKVVTGVGFDQKRGVLTLQTSPDEQYTYDIRGEKGIAVLNAIIGQLPGEEKNKVSIEEIMLSGLDIEGMELVKPLTGRQRQGQRETGEARRTGEIEAIPYPFK